jgi:hypothetical protein
MQLHPRFRNANVFLRQLRASFHDSVKENKYPPRIPKIKNPQLVLPLLRSQLP